VSLNQTKVVVLVNYADGGNAGNQSELEEYAFNIQARENARGKDTFGFTSTRLKIGVVYCFTDHKA